MLNVTSCPWGSLPQFSRIPLCWACHPHPQNSQQRYNPRVHQGYGWIWKLLGLQQLQPTKIIEHSILSWNLIFKSLVLKRSAVGFWCGVALNQESWKCMWYLNPLSGESHPTNRWNRQIFHIPQFRWAIGFSLPTYGLPGKFQLCSNIILQQLNMLKQLQYAGPIPAQG